MKFIQKKLMKAFRIYYRMMIFLLVFAFGNKVSAQQKTEWVEIFLIDTLKYVQFGVSNVYNNKYPPSNLFDSKYNTCWVSVSKKNNSALFLKLPELENIIINIFPGYGKSEELFFQNARPKKIRLSVYAAINPDGYVSEIGALYKAVKFPQEQIVHLPDSFGIQSISLTIPHENLLEFENEIYKLFNAEFEMPPGEEGLILKMEIVDSYAGSKYDDVCISELFFNDCFISPQQQTVYSVDTVYLNETENALLLNSSLHQAEVVYRDTLSVLQIMEISENKKWAILISMPAKIEGRAETTWLLVDLLGKTIVNSQLEKTAGRYLSGNEIYFKYIDNDRVFLMYHAKDGKFYQLELR